MNSFAYIPFRRSGLRGGDCSGAVRFAGGGALSDASAGKPGTLRNVPIRL